jgi:hypothetical protein
LNGKNYCLVFVLNLLKVFQLCRHGGVESNRKASDLKTKKSSNFDLVSTSSFEVIHGAVEPEDLGQVEEPLGGQDGLQGGEEGAPPGQNEHLLVGPDCQYGLVGDEVRVEDRDDTGLNSREHAGVDVVGADASRVDVAGVPPVGHLDPDGNKILLMRLVQREIT